jgi:hypothetical protein
MNTSDLGLVPLRQASLCLDCDMITTAQTHCFACGSVALMNLARTLNGNTGAKHPRRELFVVTKSSARPRQPVPFKSVPTSSLVNSHPGLKSKCSDFRRVLSSVLSRPVRDVLAMRYGN